MRFFLCLNACGAILNAYLALKGFSEGRWFTSWLNAGTFVFVVVVDHRTRLSIRRTEAMEAEHRRLIAECDRQIEAIKEDHERRRGND